MASAAKSTGRWIVITALGIVSGTACGGRGNLPVGSMDDNEGGSSFGNGPSGGTTATTGGKPVGGQSVGGSIGGGGPAGASFGGANFGGGNFGGAPFAGSGPAGGFSTVGGSAGVDWCGPGVPCRFPNTACQNGQCVQVEMCVPGSVVCDQNTLRVCNAQGTGTFVRQVCAGSQYCDAVTASCKAGVCAPNRPLCVGEVATTCNANGSGYTQPTDDCQQGENRHCEQGSCLCNGSMADCRGGQGCETDLWTDPDNCTDCGSSCSRNNMATRTCNGVCDGACKAGFDDCNGDKREDGCETRIDNDVKNCGGCGLACSTNHLAPSCVDGTCVGVCAVDFADCNLDKQSDGCESDSRSDVNNCGGCGVRCSSSHVSRACSAGQCTGACHTGFQDCNGDKQSDGCETDTRSNAQHCGACNNPCPNGEACANGQCASLFTFSGIKKNLATASLLGWTECFSQAYVSDSPLSEVLQDCSGKQLLLACRKVGSSTLQLAAHAPRTDVLFPTQGDGLHEANGVAWYHDTSQSWGFAPVGAKIELDSCDVLDSSLRPGLGTGGAERLCWHMSSDGVRGGWRCGRDDELNDSTAFERVVFHAP